MDTAGMGPLQGRSLTLANRGNWRSDAIEPMLAGLPGEGRSERLKRFRDAVKSTAKGNSSDAARFMATSQARRAASQSQDKNGAKSEGSTSKETNPKA